jgi:2-dehydropantoate 2-reductase
VKIVIIGPGAMGCLYAFFLMRSGHEVWLLDYREERAELIRSRGLKIEGVSGQFQMPFPHITADAGTIGKADIIIIFVKAYATETAIKRAGNTLKSSTIILTLQNGLGNIERISALYPDANCVAGTTAQGATLIGFGHIRHAGIGETIIGAAAGAGKFHTEIIRDLFMSALIPVLIAEDVTSLLWGKLLINCGINPMTAIMKIKNGQITAFPNLLAVMRRAVEEGALVASTLGITLPYQDPVQKVIEVCEATAENRSSMLQDIEAGKKTEIEYMNGAIVRHGKQLGINIAVNYFLADMVLALEKLNVSENTEIDVHEKKRY